MPEHVAPVAAGPLAPHDAPPEPGGTSDPTGPADPAAPGDGGEPGASAVNASVLGPREEWTSAEETPVAVGHQATNHPFPEVARTREPSLRTRVTPVTPEANCPSTSV